MTQDFRPSQVQLDYLNADMLDHLAELGFDIENYQYEINSIDWYNWDNKPRWFVNISKFSELGTKAGYLEVDIDCTDWNGEENPLEIESIKLAGHGYPCGSVQVAYIEDGDYIITES